MSLDPNARITIVIPTAINTVLMVNENIVDNLRKHEDSNIQLPSLYQRAFLVVTEADEVAIVRQEVDANG